jgi:branched-chain amino acid transport system ATP-binding protein
MRATLLRTERLTKRFGQFLALDNVSVDFREGELAAVIGPNGAGKSTFFNLISGSFPPTSGNLTFEGRAIGGLPQHAFARLGIAKSFQITNVFPYLPALENVRIAVQAMHARSNIWTPRRTLTELSERAAALLETVGILRHALRPARDMAHGEQRALEIAMALASNPRLLLLDEPTAGMSPEETRSMMDLISHLAKERTIILIEHKMKLVMGLCQRLVVLHHGQLLAAGTPDEIRADVEVKRVYLGQRQ